MKNKKAVNQVIGAIVLIAVTIGIVAGIWATINSFVDDSLDKAGSCNEVFEQIIINDAYTCYNSTNQSVMISISRKDFDLDSLLIGILGEESAKSFRLTSSNKLIQNVKYYNKADLEVNLPGKEAGKTYCVYGVDYKPLSIQASPNIGGNDCGIAAKTDNILNCDLVSC